ncbi:32636_t:CDS:2 [Gigaspora margarita]|uniref:32636_t:CDS:1 n=1 Tax=Gigaspora margarita TaxID=4874 RepID=A0ABN7UU64_GIGMA|nr:32636_t:CDS:2 [Gigaspora margarita]
MSLLIQVFAQRMLGSSELQVIVDRTCDQDMIDAIIQPTLRFSGTSEIEN